METFFETLIGVLVLCLGGVAVYFAIIYEQKQKEKKREFFETTRNNYLNSLNRLKRNPSNPDLKQQTLEYGRKFAALTRQYQGTNGVTIFDEVALMNDINAACAGAMKSNAPNNQNVEERLSKLSELKEKGLINELEFENKRRSILEEI